jgi:chromosome segregation and condensation protein ScpB
LLLIQQKYKERIENIKQETSKTKKIVKTLSNITYQSVMDQSKLSDLQILDKKMVIPK